MRRRPAATLLVLLATATPAGAHHSLAAYDPARRVTLEGVVSEFHYTQPHPFLVIQAGQPAQAWKLEMDNLYELAAIGIDRDTFRARDRVVVTGDPMHDGSHQMYLRRLDRPADGLRYQQTGFSPELTRGR